MAIIAAYVIAAMASKDASKLGVFWLGLIIWFYGVQVALVGYPILYSRLWGDASDLASHALKTAAPLSIGVLLAPIVLAPRYFSDANEERNWAVVAAATLLAIMGALAVAIGIPTLRLSWRSIGIALAAVVLIQIALIVRGLPNPPMAVAKAPLLTIEYPTDRPDLASDAPLFSERLALILKRSGSTMPAGGVYLRYRWDFGPDDPPPPKDALVLTATAEAAAKPAQRLRNFAEKVTVKLVPEPLPRGGGAHDPWLGYIGWIFAPDDAETRARLVTDCESLVNRQQHIGSIGTAPYVRLEGEQGVAAAQALYARAVQGPPDSKQWDTRVSDGCAYVLAHR